MLVKQDNVPTYAQEVSIDVEKGCIEVDCNSLKKLIQDIEQAKEILALLPC